MEYRYFVCPALNISCLCDRISFYWWLMANFLAGLAIVCALLATWHMLLCLDSAQIRLSPKPGASDGYKVPTHIKDQRFVVDNIGIKNIFFFTVFLSLLMDGGHPLVCMIWVDDVSEKIILFHNEAFPEGRNCMIWPKDGHKILLIEQHFRLWSCRASQLKNKSERK